MPRGRFPKGHKFAKGGARPGAGRPSNDIREKCQALLETTEGLERLGYMLKGGKVPQFVKSLGQTVDGPVSPETIVDIVKFLTDRAYGKATQPIDHSGEVQIPYSLVVRIDDGNSG